MNEMEKRTIIDFLRSSDFDLGYDLSTLSLSELIDLVIEKANETELDYSILSTAYASGVNPQKFDDFYEAVMGQYEMVMDGGEIPVPVLDKIATQYR